MKRFICISMLIFLCTSCQSKEQDNPYLFAGSELLSPSQVAESMNRDLMSHLIQEKQMRKINVNYYKNGMNVDTSLHDLVFLDSNNTTYISWESLVKLFKQLQKDSHSIESTNQLKLVLADAELIITPQMIQVTRKNGLIKLIKKQWFDYEIQNIDQLNHIESFTSFVDNKSMPYPLLIRHEGYWVPLYPIVNLLGEWACVDIGESIELVDNHYFPRWVKESHNQPKNKSLSLQEKKVLFDEMMIGINWYYNDQDIYTERRETQLTDVEKENILQLNDERFYEGINQLFTQIDPSTTHGMLFTHVEGLNGRPANEWVESNDTENISFDKEKGWYYLKMCSFEDGYYQTLMEKLPVAFEENGTDPVKLLVDLRGNSIGEMRNALDFYKNLFNEPIQFIFSTNQCQMSNSVTMITTDKPTSPRIHSLLVLVDEATQGAAHQLAVILKNNHLGLIIGKVTGGGSGIFSCYSLSDGTVILMDSGLFFLDEKGYAAHAGVVPDIILSEDMMLDSPVNIINSLKSVNGLMVE